MTVEFGWIVSDVVRANISETRALIFAILSPLDKRTDGGVGEMRCDTTNARWHLFVGNLGVGHRPPEGVVLPCVYAKLEWLDGSRELRKGEVIRPTTNPTLPVNFTQSFTSDARCLACGSLIEHVHQVVVELGELRHSMQAQCHHCGHMWTENTDKVVGAALVAAKMDPKRIALRLPSVRSQGMLRAIARGIPYDQDAGAGGYPEYEELLFIGLPFHAMHIAQRLLLRRFEVDILDC